MADIEHRIADWRKLMGAATGAAAEVIDELESHLRDDMQRLMLSGETEESALDLAVARLGTPLILAAEFAKVTPESPGTWLPVWVANGVLLLMAVGLFALVGARIQQGGRWDFLLASHVIAITLGYVCTFTVGALAVCYVVVRLFRDLAPGQAQALARELFGLTCLGLGLTAVGVVLGGFWAREHLGRFWGWDPRETGAALVVAWDVAMLLFCWRRPASVRVAALLAFVGNIVVTAAWFGPNLLETGLHAYGFPARLGLMLLGFVITQVVLVGIGLVPAGVLRRRMA